MAVNDSSGATSRNQLIGQRFGKLVVTERAENSPQGKRRWNCKCDCGRTSTPHANNLLRGLTKSCGCGEQENRRRSRQPPLKKVKDRRGFACGRLTVIGPWSRRGRRIFWLCECECGGTKEVEWDSLAAGATRSCGCLPLGSTPGQQREVADLSGHRFGILTIVSRAANRGYKVRWICQCDCGTVREFDIAKVKSGRTRSCGCTHNIRHGGKSLTREYRIWAKMKDRCYNQNVDNYRFYGARGTSVCGGWRTSFEEFLADMGVAPSGLHSIDRENPHGHYSCGHCDECKASNWPANCRWATKKTQDRNRRKHVRVTHNGKTLLLKEWAELSGIGYHTLYSRVVVRGWSFELAISTPQGASRGNGSPRRH